MFQNNLAYKKNPQNYIMADFVVMENENNSLIQRLSTILIISISSGDYAVVGKSH